MLGSDITEIQGACWLEDQRGPDPRGGSGADCLGQQRNGVRFYRKLSHKRTDIRRIFRSGFLKISDDERRDRETILLGY